MSDRSTSRGFGVVTRAGRVERGSRPWVGVEELEERRLLATFVVTSNGDVPVVMGTTLRQAILLANANPGADVIRFNIAGTPTIHPLTALPEITDATTIDGTTQPGYAPGAPVVYINGTGTLPDLTTGNADGLRFVNDGANALRGVIVGGFDAGAGVSVVGASGGVIAGNWIGTDATGEAGNGNIEGLVIDSSSDMRIGGTTLADRNVVSGNFLDGIRVTGSGADGNVIEGNFIGVNASGNADLGNSINGISVEPGSTTDLLIGGTAAGARNVVSGNEANGISIDGASGVTVAGNYLGTNAAGTAAIPNDANGVIVTGDSSDVLVGGTTAAARNVSSGNEGDGVRVDATGTGNAVQGNYLGVDATGTARVGNVGNGVTVESAGVLVGGDTAAAGNVASGNDGFGVEVVGDGNRVEFNRIGTTADGTAAIGNNGDGIRIDGADNVIGTPTTGNTIAYNDRVGVLVDFDPAFVRNAIRGNNIYLNGSLGIDLGDDGVTMNDPQDPDQGPNEFQNFPVLTAITLSGGTATISGTLNSTPNSTFAIDLFASQIWDTSTYGEGQKYLGSTSVTTDAAGNGAFTATVSGVPSGWNYFAATATDAVGNTSEFSYDPTPGAPADGDKAKTKEKASSKPTKPVPHSPFGNRKLATLFDRAAADNWLDKIGRLLARA